MQIKFDLKKKIIRGGGAEGLGGGKVGGWGIFGNFFLVYKHIY